MTKVSERRAEIHGVFSEAEHNSWMTGPPRRTMCHCVTGVSLVEFAWILQLRENWEIVRFLYKVVIKMQ